MAWGSASWGQTPYEVDTQAWGIGSEDLLPIGLMAPDAKSRYVREYLSGMPFSVGAPTQSLLSRVISAIEEEDFNIAGPIR